MGIRKALLAKLELTIYHSLLQLQQQMQSTDIQEGEIRISINLLYAEGSSEKLQCILRSHKIRSIFHTESTLCKLLCKWKDQVATEDKNNVNCKIDCSDCEGVYFNKSKCSLKIAFR